LGTTYSNVEPTVVIGASHELAPAGIVVEVVVCGFPEPYVHFTVSPQTTLGRVLGEKEDEFTVTFHRVA
jgi:hypothetical protein